MIAFAISQLDRMSVRRTASKSGSLDFQILKRAEVDGIGRHIAQNGRSQALERTLDAVYSDCLPHTLEDGCERRCSQHDALLSDP